MRSAYAAAWAAREEQGDDSDEVLRAALHDHGLLVESAPDTGPLQQVLLRVWRRGAPPRRFERELNREVRRMGFDVVTQLGRAFLELARMLRRTPTPRRNGLLRRCRRDCAG